MQGADGRLVLVAVVAGELAALAEEDDVVDVVPALDDIESGFDLPLEFTLTGSSSSPPGGATWRLWGWWIGLRA
ncbi:hypothetical protein [Streptomyces sp. MNP-20]|uniref:hypothetical protein n=1 Tax=Streptomyces sp. MNP-20 TaxID=2721165 RepID=UPI0020A6AAFB|nr:hypothetical protein [Streptomyces sp. MNP-20]